MHTRKQNIKKKSTKSFSAVINIGLQYGYSKQTIKENDIYKAIQEFQDDLIQTKKIYLSVSATPCYIVLSGQIEPHLKLGFINYPKFSQDERTLKLHIEELAEFLMDRFAQNRIVVEYPDQTLMLEIDDNIDPDISQGKSTGH